MRIAIGSDHAGYHLKRELADRLDAWGHQVTDLGTDSPDPVDYPDFAEAVALAVIEDGADRGVLICGSGVGASVAANKVPGIRAGLCHDTYSAHQSVEHDNVNVLVMGSRVIGSSLAEDVLKAFLGATFTGEKRHVRRLGKLGDLEARFRRKN